MTIKLNLDRLSDDSKPMDHVEHILIDNGWIFQRASDEEIALSLQGKACTYRLFFMWQDDMQALQLACQYDLKIQEPFTTNLHSTLAKVNEKLWFGHFDIPQNTGKPCFRHTCLLRNADMSGTLEQIEDLIDFSLQQCERYFQTFQLLTMREKQPSNDSISLALMETKGEC